MVAKFADLFAPTVEFDDDTSALVQLKKRARQPVINEPEVNLLTAYEAHFDDSFAESAPVRERLFSKFFQSPSAT